MNKRSRSTAFDSKPKLRLKLACTTTAPTEPAAAALAENKQVVCLFSSVVAELPETGEWDLSGLLVEGQPGSRAIVVAWLNAAYQAAYEEDFEAPEPDQNPACSVERLYMLLSFADAVDSTRPVFRACCSQLQRLQLRGQLGQQQVALDTNGVGYFFDPKSGELCRQPILVAGGLRMPAAPDAASAEQQAAFKQQVAAQTEQLLWLAHRLQLAPLVQHMHSCIQALSFFATSVLRGLDDVVFTPRVLEAAGVAGLPAGKQMLINSVRGEVLTLANSASLGPASLQPIGLTQQQQQPLRFNAVVNRSTLSTPGDTVAVELDLFVASTMMLGSPTFAVQLRLGPYIQ